jgi:2-C-methyl-D-erythritol 2,4-cyclodiphosphate synthase
MADLTENIFRVGIGYDVHRLVDDRRLIIGGERIVHPTGLLGHSDADVLTHAVMSAILGAMAAGSLGDHFPDTDPQYKDISSMDLLERVRILMEEGGYQLQNLDTMVICDKPRMSPYIENIRLNLSEALRVPTERVSVKATSTEGLGFTGTGDGIAAQAICLLKIPAEESPEPKKKKPVTKKKKAEDIPLPLPKILSGDIKNVVARIDGASDGNPGPSGIGIIFETPDGVKIGELAEAIGEKTNNQAEYLAAIKAVQICHDWHIEKISLITDSELLAKQLIGAYKVKNPGILELYKELSCTLKYFKEWKVKHIPRTQNVRADQLSKLALKK